MLNYARLFKRGLCNFPQALDLLDLIRKDIVELKKEVSNLEHKSYQQCSSTFNIKGIYTKLKWLQERKKLEQLQDQILESNSALEFNTLSSIRTSMSSDDALLRLSFHTNESVHDMKKILDIHEEGQKSKGSSSNICESD